MQMRRWIYGLAIVTGLGIAKAQDMQSPEAGNAVQAAKSDTAALRAVHPLLPAQIANNAGLFIGVGNFEAKEDFPPLPRVVDDTVAVAHALVTQLRWIPPRRAWVVLSDEPVAESTRAKLDALKASGANVLDATQANLSRAVLEMTALNYGPQAVGIIACSTYLVEQLDAWMLVPCDGRDELLGQAVFPVQSLLSALAASDCTRRLLVFEAWTRADDETDANAERFTTLFSKDHPGTAVWVSEPLWKPEESDPAAVPQLFRGILAGLEADTIPEKSEWLTVGDLWAALQNISSASGKEPKINYAPVHGFTGEGIAAAALAALRKPEPTPSPTPEATKPDATPPATPDPSKTPQSRSIFIPGDQRVPDPIGIEGNTR